MEHREEHGEVALRRNPQLDVAHALEGALNLGYSCYETRHNQHGHRVAVHRDDVADAHDDGMIGLGTILSIPFVSEKVKWFVPAACGLVVVLLNLIVSKMYLSIPYLIPLGFKIYGFSTLDYEPLIPWFGVMLIGIAIGKLLYPGGVRRSFLEKLGSMPRVLTPLCFAGRHTLIIYLAHVPVIILVMILFGIIDMGVFF